MQKNFNLPPSNSIPEDLENLALSESSSQVDPKHKLHLNKKRRFFIGSAVALVLVVIGVVASLTLIRQSLENRGEASQKSGPKLSIEPKNITGNKGDVVELKVYVDSDMERVSAAEVEINYNQSRVEIIETKPGTALPVELVKPNARRGSLKFTLGSSPTNPLSGKEAIATIKIKLLSTSSSTITFNRSSKVMAINKNDNALAETFGARVQHSTKAGTKNANSKDDVVVERAEVNLKDVKVQENQGSGENREIENRTRNQQLDNSEQRNLNTTNDNQVEIQDEQNNNQQVVTQQNEQTTSSTNNTSTAGQATENQVVANNNSNPTKITQLLDPGFEATTRPYVETNPADAELTETTTTTTDTSSYRANNQNETTPASTRNNLEVTAPEKKSFWDKIITFFQSIFKRRAYN